jgi:hypothetical protein
MKKGRFLRLLILGVLGSGARAAPGLVASSSHQNDPDINNFQPG